VVDRDAAQSDADVAHRWEGLDKIGDARLSRQEFIADYDVAGSNLWIDKEWIMKRVSQPVPIVALTAVLSVQSGSL
jgi:hypothetical protein